MIILVLTMGKECLIAMVGRNGMTYIGKTSEYSEGEIAISLTNYVVVPTEKIVSEMQESFIEKAKNFYKTLKKDKGPILIHGSRDRGIVHELNEL